MLEEDKTINEEDKTKNQEQEGQEQEGEEEDYFNPFADVKEEDEEEEQEDEKNEEEEGEEEDKKTKKVVKGKVKQESQEDLEARARLDAIDIVDEFVENNEQYADLKKELRELTAKAIQKGYSNPIEFARRNVKSPDYWIKLGEQRAKEAIENARASTIRFTSASAGVGSEVDYEDMDKKEFEQLVEKVKSSR
ncbi:MAG: hypothetical protein BWY21_02038 [Parcubacteria group bacterium ADurb.Bin216]|nr:MAG: hypothetical protein BWY21_02038 [Parcubacteria group bacterium ADurb.Bin216]